MTSSSLTTEERLLTAVRERDSNTVRAILRNIVAYCKPRMLLACLNADAAWAAPICLPLVDDDVVYFFLRNRGGSQHVPAVLPYINITSLLGYLTRFDDDNTAYMLAQHRVRVPGCTADEFQDYMSRGRVGFVLLFLNSIRFDIRSDEYEYTLHRLDSIKHRSHVRAIVDGFLANPSVTPVALLDALLWDQRCLWIPFVLERAPTTLPTSAAVTRALHRGCVPALEMAAAKEPLPILSMVCNVPPSGRPDFNAIRSRCVYKLLMIMHKRQQLVAAPPIPRPRHLSMTAVFIRERSEIAVVKRMFEIVKDRDELVATVLGVVFQHAHLDMRTKERTFYSVFTTTPE